MPDVAVTPIRYHIGSSLLDLHQLSEKLADHEALRDFSPKQRYGLETALEELVTNAIKYGLPSSPEPLLEITIESAPPDTLVLIIRDNGGPFDPSQKPEKQKPVDLESMPMGGLGLSLVHDLSDRIIYQRKGQENFTTVYFAKETPLSGRP